MLSCFVSGNLHAQRRHPHLIDLSSSGFAQHRAAALIYVKAIAVPQLYLYPPLLRLGRGVLGLIAF
jgi:hypothetical protein